MINWNVSSQVDLRREDIMLKIEYSLYKIHFHLALVFLTKLALSVLLAYIPLRHTHTHTHIHIYIYVCVSKCYISK